MSVPPVTATLKHRIEYALFAAAVAVGCRVSERTAARLAAAAGRLAYRPFGIRRSIVEAHIRLAFPERDEAWVQRTAAAAYVHLGREAIAMLRMATLTREHVLERTSTEGFEAFREQIEAARGGVIVTGHIGNWEIGAATLAARGIPTDVVAQRQANALFDGAVVAARQRLGVQVIERRRAPRQALRSLRAGRVVAFVADQNARRAGIFVPFFGRPASTHRGPALMAIRAGKPLFLGIALRVADGHYHVRIDEIETDRSGEPDTAVHRLTAAFTAGLEAAVKLAPDQYFWHHRRWRTRPAEERIPEAAV